MPSDQIDEKDQVDTLFVLVGTNPLPAWVSASLLLKPGGKLHLVHSGSRDKQVVQSQPGTAGLASRLGEQLRRKGIQQINYIPIDDESNPLELGSALSPWMREIESGHVGLDYTGGTKVMAVHAFQALQEFASGPLFTDRKITSQISYLDARRCRLMVLHLAASITRGDYLVLLNQNCEIKFRTLINLHGSYKTSDLSKEVLARPLIEAILAGQKDYSSSKKWRDWCQNLHPQKIAAHALAEKVEGAGADDRTTSSPQVPVEKVEIPSSDTFPEVSRVMRGQYQQDRLTLGDVYHSLGFSKVTDLSEFLFSKWLEHHALAALQEISEEAHIHDVFRNALPISFKRQFEADVVAVRGYQLFLISCFSGQDNDLLKQHLFEAYIRAHQLGGDEACVGLVCLTDNPKGLQNQVAEDWNIQGKVMVFGRQELTTLDQGFLKWFISAGG